MSDALHMPPLRSPGRFWALMFGACAAPIFWLGQLMLGYGVSAFVCYGSDHPTTVASGTALRMALYAFDAVAIFAALAGGVVAFICWRTTREHARAHFMALWGVMSSLWFLGAIIFNTIGSATVPLCIA
ncbi:MAG TPA: hypothetical protein VK759_05515 [Rhizomicrobium sp.]|nr:hypothetical protein [Rhizomicrobium sp.]